MYSIADVAMITSLRDGFNKIAFEYVACHALYNPSSAVGCLILSELSGAAQGLGAGALLVNPYDVPDVTATLKSALEELHVDDDYKKSWSYLSEYVRNNTSAMWAHNFISEMRNLDVLDSDESDNEIELYECAHVPIDTVAAVYSASKGRRLIVLGVVGTMMDYEHFRTMSEIPTSIITSIQDLLADSRNTVVVISGRERAVMNHWIGQLPVWLVAENGLYIRFGGNDTEWK